MPASVQRLRAWCLLRDQHAHIEPVEAAFGNDAEFIYDADWQPSQLLAQAPDILLCVNDYHPEIVRCLDAARQAWIPSLALQDGILEWRCQYENPLFGAGGGAPQHQPVLADKIACIGHASARQLAAWGNAAKVEIAGMPRLDYLLTRKTVPLQTPGSRLLVMTAKNPGFNAHQRECTLQSLRDLKHQLDARPHVQVLWRVSKSVAAELGVVNQLNQVSSAELADLLDQVDAVITTLSTAILEAMLLGRPVAALDYHNVPRFQQTAWTMSAPGHIPQVLEELLRPPATKMLFQQSCLADSLQCCTPAAQRVRQLILKMVEAARGQTVEPAHLPANLLNGWTACQVFPRPSLKQLYPGVPVFQETEVETLQVRLARAENENARLRAQNTQLRFRGRWENRLKHIFNRLQVPGRAR